MSSEGYGAATEIREHVTRTLKDIAVLIGEGRDEPYTTDTGSTVVPGLGMREDAAALTLRAADLAGGLFKILVLGEFKNGKSTLLNSMLGAKTLPAKAAPATAIITMLVYGDNPDVAVYEAGASQPRMVPWDAFVQEFQLTREDSETLQDRGTVDRFAHIAYAQIECRHPICAHGVKLIDSPGLGEHISRTRVSTDFLKQSQAVILVLNATRILGQEERSFIERALGEGRLPHVFFVVNRINQVDQDSVEEIKRWVESTLAHHFLDESGAFDRDFYERRVYFVDAKRALDARSGLIPGDVDLDATGVPALERELEQFLTGEERIAAVLDSSVQVLGPVLSTARKRISTALAALDAPLEDLERRHADSLTRLAALERRKTEIERTVRLFGEAIQHKIYSNLVVFVDEMHESWDDDVQRVTDIDQVLSLKELFNAYTHPEMRAGMAAAITREVQLYLQVKFGEWADRVPAAIGPDIEVMVAEVEAQVDDFQLELDTIASVFAGTPITRGDGSGPAGARLLQMAFSFSDIGGLTDGAFDLGDWPDVLKRLAQQAVLIFIGSLLTGSVLTALLAVQAIQFIRHEGELKKRIRRTVGDRLHAGLQEQLREKRTFIYSAIEERFREFSAAMIGVMQQQIDELRAEQDRILAQKRDEHFSADRERRRLDEIETALTALSGDLERAAKGAIATTVPT